MNKYKYIKCDQRQEIGHVQALGRVYGNFGKEKFKCGNCGHHWQYGVIK